MSSEFLMSAKFTGKCCTCGYKIDVGAWIIKRPVKPLPFRHGDISESLFGAGARGYLSPIPMYNFQ